MTVSNGFLLGKLLPHDSAYVQARQDYAYSSLTGTPAFISVFTNDAGYLTAATVLDSGEVIAFIDSAYVQARQTVQDFSYSSLTGTPNVLDSADVLAIASTVGGVDSAAVLATVEADGYTKYDSVSFTGQLAGEVGSSILAYDANLQSFVTAFTLPTTDGSSGQVLTTNGTGTISWGTVSGGGGGGAVDSASITSIVNENLLTLDITSIVGTDGQPGDVLQSLGNGQATWQPNVSLSYEFKVSYNDITEIDSAQELPAGWTLDSQDTDTLWITHNTGRTPKSLSFTSYQVDGTMLLVNSPANALSSSSAAEAKNSFILTADPSTTGASPFTFAIVNLVF